MQRTVLSTLSLTVALALAPALAAAEEPPMCAEGMVPMSLPAWLLPGSLDMAVRAAPAPTPTGTEVLWCRSAYDTRCSPQPSPGDNFFSSLLHTLLAPALVARASVPPPPVRTATFVDARLTPRDGATSRLERPPR